eukprot:122592-Amphidinium_carterae.1
MSHTATMLKQSQRLKLYTQNCNAIMCEACPRMKHSLLTVRKALRTARRPVLADLADRPPLPTGGVLARHSTSSKGVFSNTLEQSISSFILKVVMQHAEAEKYTNLSFGRS